MSTLKERYIRNRVQVAECALECGRSTDEVALIAVSKTVGALEVGEAIEAGATRFGENRPEQLVMKQKIYPEVEWHFIGNIQSRRIDDIVSAATLIHSVCKVDHLRKIDAAAKKHGKVQRILLEVNVSGEDSKSGFTPAEVPDALMAADAFENIQVCGFMTMAPQGDLNAADATFKGLAELRDKCANIQFPVHGTLPLNELSMGMSEDWRQAIAQGATMVRIGRAIFSEDF